MAVTEAVVVDEADAWILDKIAERAAAKKAKNYALLGMDDSISLTGAALKSRALEPFQRKFILQAVAAKLHDDPGALDLAYENWKEAIRTRSIPLEDLAKSEVLSDSPENYCIKDLDQAIMTTEK